MTLDFKFLQNTTTWHCLPHSLLNISASLTHFSTLLWNANDGPLCWDSRTCKVPSEVPACLISASSQFIQLNFLPIRFARKKGVLCHKRRVWLSFVRWCFAMVLITLAVDWMLRINCFPPTLSLHSLSSSHPPPLPLLPTPFLLLCCCCRHDCRCCQQAHIFSSLRWNVLTCIPDAATVRHYYVYVHQQSCHAAAQGQACS